MLMFYYAQGLKVENVFERAKICVVKITVIPFKGDNHGKVTYKYKKADIF